MGCEIWRETLSARADCEAEGLDPELVDAHVAGCAECREFRDALIGLNRMVRITPAEPVPDRTAAILAAIAADRPRWATQLTLRWLLVVVAALEMGMAVPDLLGRWHTGGELSTWAIATAIGFLAAAARPQRAGAMLPMLIAAAALTAFVGMRDIVDGNTSLSAEWPHGLLILGVALLGLLRRTGYDPQGESEIASAGASGSGRGKLRRAA